VNRHTAVDKSGKSMSTNKCAVLYTPWCR